MIEVKYNINFKKALKLFRKDKLTKFTNNKLAPQTAKAAQKYIRSGKMANNKKTRLSKNNPRGTKAKPLFDTRKLHDSLKGGTQGISGVDYAKQHREPDGYLWFKKGTDAKGKGIGGYVEVPQREFIPHYEDSAKGRRILALKGTGKDLEKIYDVFKKKFIKLILKNIKKNFR